ncbi:MAG: hypothetical protein ABIP93_16870 [Gemmatimonadaceae bacterium]
MWPAFNARGTIATNGFLGHPGFPALDRYTHRRCYVLSRGRSTAEIAVFDPTSSLWLGDAAAASSTLRIARTLMEHQRDFDWVDETSLTSVLAQKRATLLNLSGQGYRTVLVPSVGVLSTGAIERLHSFARAEGTRAANDKIGGIVSVRQSTNEAWTPRALISRACRHFLHRIPATSLSRPSLSRP